MYYKVENTESEVYQKLHKMRSQELQFEEENKATIENASGLKWNRYLGNFGQQNWNRVSSYNGFEFTEPDKVDLKIWKESKQYKGVYEPNRRTKKGREMAQFLSNGLKGHAFDIVFRTLGIEHRHRFSFPVVEICGETIVLFFGEDYQIASDDIIEITSKEFEEIRKAAHAQKQTQTTQND